MRVWDLRRGIQAMHAVEELKTAPVALSSGSWETLDALAKLRKNGLPESKTKDDLSGITLYAALFEPRVESLAFNYLPKSHHDGPNLLNVQRYLDVPQAVALAAEKSDIQIYQKEDEGWEYPFAVADKLGWNNRIQIWGEDEKGVSLRRSAKEP